MTNSSLAVRFVRRGSLPIWIGLLLLQYRIQAQNFVDLDFELASIFVPPAYWGDVVDPTNAFPKWKVQGYCLHNNLTLGTPAVDLIGPVFPNGPGLNALQGSYSVFIQNFSGTGPQSSISQTATIPAWAKSVSFLTSPQYFTNGLVSVNGIAVPLTLSGPNRMAGDITAFAGQVATITFSSVGFLQFDDVQFLSARFATPRPTLAIEPTGTNTLLVSWPASAASFWVQQSANLNPAQWTTFTNVPVLAGSQTQVIVPEPGAPMFFRLVSE